MPRVILTLVLIFMARATSLAVEIEVAPGQISPGDAFMVRATGAELEPVGMFEGRVLSFAGCGDGCFVALGAVNLDAKPGEHTISLSVGGKKQSATLKVTPKEFPVIELTLPPDKVTLSPEDEKRAEEEARMLNELWVKETDRLWRGEFISPLDNELSTGFGVKRIMNKVKTSIHTGVDVRGGMGEHVRAANRGKVVLADNLFFGGNTLVIDHGQGIYTVYMHLSKFSAKVGEIVEKGQTVGEVGATGRATGPHLHYAVKIGPVSANPTSIIKLPL